nr:hypothetical protein [Mangrovivirga cuniculi]
MEIITGLAFNPASFKIEAKRRLISAELPVLFAITSLGLSEVYIE